MLTYLSTGSKYERNLPVPILDRKSFLLLQT